jgi:hypothetical protein
MIIEFRQKVALYEKNSYKINNYVGALRIPGEGDFPGGNRAREEHWIHVDGPRPKNGMVFDSN